MDTEDLATIVMVFVACFVIVIVVLLGLIATAIWFIHLEPVTQVFYGVVFLIALVLSAIVTYFIVR